MLLCSLSSILTSPPVSTLFSSPHISPHVPLREAGDTSRHFLIEEKLPSRTMLEVAESLPSSYPGCCCLSAQSYPPLQGSLQHLAISSKCHFRENKTEQVCCIGSDHQVQLTRSFPQHLPTKALQALQPFHAQTVGKIFS